METPKDVLLRLIRNNPETIMAFTYKRVDGNKYLNYYVTLDLDLESKVEDFPVTFDGLPFTPGNHGLKYDIENGFGITGIEFPFRCPDGWNFKDGKCILDPICKPDDIDVYKGINYYQFAQARTNDIFHPRVYIDCNTLNLKNCAINELYIGGESISQNLNPCEPYDLCQDMLTMSTHNYPIFSGDVLEDNEFYICKNGVSERRICPDDTKFSRMQGGCLPYNMCLDAADGTRLDRGNDDSFILCRGGLENIVRCANGVFRNNGTIECVNSSCLNPRILYETFSNRITIPVGKVYCAPNTNEPVEFRCSNNIKYFEDVNDLTNDIRIVGVPIPRFEMLEIPSVQYDPDTDTCISFDFDLNFIVMGTHNPIVPDIPLNLKTMDIDYSDRGEEEFYYRNYTVIMRHPTGEIVITEKNFANFLTTPDLDIFEYVPEVNPLIGSNDGITYFISALTSKHLLSTVTIYNNPFDVSSGDPNMAWNAYLNDFTDLDSAHSAEARLKIGSAQGAAGGDFGLYTYTFKYFVTDTLLHVLTPYGFCTFNITLNSEQVIDDDGFLEIVGFPEYSVVQETLKSKNDRMIVTNIYNGEYNFNHMAYFLNYMKITSLVAPLNSVSSNMSIEDFFDIDSSRLYKYSSL